MVKKASQADRSPSLNLALLLILLLGLCLRVWGMFWSLPSDGGFSYHPDEVFQVIAASRIDIGELQLNPHFYNYGAMYMYIVSGATSIAAEAGWIDASNMAGRYIVARLITVLLGALIPYLVYLIGLRVYDRKIGLFAACIAAITPIAVQHSHFATVDIAATFFVTACLAASANIYRKATILSCLAAGLCAGFAGATKYTTAIVVVAPMAALLIGAWALEPREKLRLTPWIIGGALLGFVIGNPGCILWTDEFLRAFLHEFSHSQAGHGLVFANTGPGWLFHLTSSLLYGLGLPCLLVALIGLVLMALDNGRRGWFLLIFIALYYLVISLSQVRFARYIIPLTPVLAIAFTLTVAAGFNGVTRMRSGTVRVRQMLLAGWFLLCLGVVYHTFAYTLALDRLFIVRDPQSLAAEYMEHQVPSGSVVAFPTLPWFYSPALSPGFTSPLPNERLAAAIAVKRYELLVNPDRNWDMEPLLSGKVDYAVLSDYEDIDPVRAKDKAATEYLQLLRSHSPLVACISNRLRGGGISFGDSERLPHDMKYASPRITIYKYKRRG